MKSSIVLAIIGAALLPAASPVPVTLTTTPQSLPCTSPRYADNLRVAVVPGGTGKVFIGTSNMNVNTLAGTINILMPNSGAHSEEYKLSLNGIDLCSLYIAGQVAGETALLTFDPRTDVPASVPAPYVVGPVTRTGSSAASIGTGIVDLLQVTTVPGQSGKVTVARDTFMGHETDNSYTGAVKVLYPNTGMQSQHSNFTERFDVSNVKLDILRVYPDIAGENALVTAWRYSNFAQSTYDRRLEAGSVTLSSTPARLTSNFPLAHDIHIRVIPGYCGKVYVGNASMNTTTLAGVAKVLWPNCGGGHSEEVTLYANEVGSHDVTDLYVAGQYAGDKILWQAKVCESCLTGAANWPASADVNHSVSAITLSSTPQRISGTSLDFVHAFRISTVPGNTGKIFIGLPTMNTSTLAGVAAVLYPNSVGRWSEEFLWNGGSGNIINLNGLAIAGQVSGETALLTVTDRICNTCYAYNRETSLISAGLVSSSATISVASDVRIQTIPGMSGKVHVGTSAMTLTGYSNLFRILWPNTGNYNIGEGFSETFQFSTSGAQAIKVLPEVSGEAALLAVFSR
jgi:hypothetical protein